MTPTIPLKLSAEGLAGKRTPLPMAQPAAVVRIARKRTSHYLALSLTQSAVVARSPRMAGIRGLTEPTLLHQMLARRAVTHPLTALLVASAG